MYTFVAIVTVAPTTRLNFRSLRSWLVMQRTAESYVEKYCFLGILYSYSLCPSAIKYCLFILRSEKYSDRPENYPNKVIANKFSIIEWRKTVLTAFMNCRKTRILEFLSLRLRFLVSCSNTTIITARLNNQLKINHKIKCCIRIGQFPWMTPRSVGPLEGQHC